MIDWLYWLIYPTSIWSDHVHYIRNQQPLEVVDHHLPAHLAFLDRYFSQGTFIASGRKVPRTGGIILATGVTKEQLAEILLEDPFNQHGVALYEVIEFEPNRTGPDYTWFLGL